MQQLTPQDAVFLSLETEALPAHIGGLAFLVPSETVEFSYDRFVDFIRERLGACDRFSWQLQEVPMIPPIASTSRTTVPFAIPPMAGLHDICPIVSRLDVTRRVRAPSRAAATAASDPAWPPPITITS